MKLTLFYFYTTILFIGLFLPLNAQNNSVQNVDDLLTNTQWNSLFPKRAGTYGAHPQGYTTDFYSYLNFKQAVSEMSDYLVQIRKKPGVWGELTTITKKSTNQTYNYSQVDSWWYTNTTPEIVINVDFADFVSTNSAFNNKRELAAFLANISKETTGGWQTPVGGNSPGDYAQWGLYFVHEVGLTSANCNSNVYSDSGNLEYPPTPGQCYFGRGPIQLSWNYNYGQFSKFLYNDKYILLNNPNLVQQDGVLAFKSAIWFWMMPQCPKPSCHQAMQELWLPQTGEYTSTKMYKKGFAHTNNIINGGLECRNTSTAAFTQKVVLRSELYKYYLSILGLTPTEIALEDSGNYSTLCYENSSNAMQDYQSCSQVVLNTENFDLDLFEIYPNPGDNELFVNHSDVINSIEIYNALGQKIKTFQPNSLNVKLNTENFPSGFYLIYVKSQKNQAVINWVKK
jgi:basic endochitinase B